MASKNALLKQPTNFLTVVPSDTTDTSRTAQLGVWVGGAGNLAVMGLYDTVAVTLAGIAAGTYVPGQFKRIMATGTTATLIVSFYGGRAGP
jgi:hypothetical protein